MFSNLNDYETNMAAITKNVFSNQFSISFPIRSCYLLKMTKNTLFQFGVEYSH